jgi:hypothetical protein
MFLGNITLLFNHLFEVLNGETNPLGSAHFRLKLVAVNPSDFFRLLVYKSTSCHELVML